MLLNVSFPTSRRRKLIIKSSSSKRFWLDAPKILLFILSSITQTFVSRSCALAFNHNNKNNKFKPLLLRSSDPLDLERLLLKQHSADFLIGSDESGTGCLAGPVVCVSCGILTQPLFDYSPIANVADSKTLTSLQCRTIYEHVLQNPDIYQWTSAIRSNTDIDQSSSVQQCTQEAFRESIEELAGRIQQNQSKNSANKVQFYSIVDGHRSPHRCQIRSRPWKKADATVYTVALASCIARAIHEEYMQQQAAIQYPVYGFDTHGGYPVQAHIQALHSHGPCPLHRRSCQPVFNRFNTVIPATNTATTTTPTTTTTISVIPHQQPTTPSFVVSPPSSVTKTMILRQSFLHAAAALVGGAFLGTRGVEPAMATYVDAKTKIVLPEMGDIESAVPTEWSKFDNPLFDDKDDDDVSSSMARLDMTSDAIFYDQPRFVEHVDEQAVRILSDYIRNTALQQQRRTDPPITSVLDLCASWTSHIIADQPAWPLQRVAGLGMNAQELAANPALTEWTVQDLNVQPKLPYADHSFDVVLCQLSIDYLTHPLAVCREIGRVLKPNGTVHILFSNRLFLSKAVALWTGKDDIDHAFIVASYLHFCYPSLFTNIRARDLSVRNKQGRVKGDPLYVVTAQLSSSH